MVEALLKAGKTVSMVVVLGAAGLVMEPAAASNTDINIIVEDNVIAGNGLGIYLGWTGDWAIQISGNQITQNGEGIRIVNRFAIIEDNEIVGNVVGVQVTETHQEEVVTETEAVILRNNIIEGNELYAVQNLSDVVLLAEGNWWGRPEGPVMLVESLPESDKPRWKIEWTLCYLPSLDEELSLHMDSNDLAQTLSLADSVAMPSQKLFEDITLAAGFGKIGLHVFFLPRLILVDEESDFPSNLVVGPLKCSSWLTSPPNAVEE